MVRSVAGEMLMALGYEVETTRDGREAIEEYTRAKESGTPFHAVLMDLTIPGGMGGGRKPSGGSWKSIPKCLRSSPADIPTIQ